MVTLAKIMLRASEIMVSRWTSSKGSSRRTAFTMPPPSRKKKKSANSITKRSKTKDATFRSTAPSRVARNSAARPAPCLTRVDKSAAPPENAPAGACFVIHSHARAKDGVCPSTRPRSIARVASNASRTNSDTRNKAGRIRMSVTPAVLSAAARVFPTRFSSRSCSG